MLRCAELGLSDSALAGMNMGMVYDMLTEQVNDGEKYDLKPAPGSMRQFFGGGNLGRPH